MPDQKDLQEFLAGGHVDAAVFELRPDYRAMLLAVDGLVPGPSDQASEALLRAAEAAAGEALRDRPAEQLPHVAAWREAYRAFGAKPQRTRNSLEALAAPRGVRPAPGEPAHRPLQRGLGAAPGPARRGGPDPLRRARRGSSAPPATSPSTPSPTAPR